MKRAFFVAAVVLVWAFWGVLALAQTTISTDGDVEAQGFIGDGSQVTNVDVDTLDGSDSTDFAGASETASVIAALQSQLLGVKPCVGGWPRYADLGDGTVLDCNTGLYWLKDASCADLAGTDEQGRANWATAQSAAAALSDGTCGLTDGSVATDWREPTISEFCSLGADVGTCPSENASNSLIDSSLSGAPYVSNAAGTGLWTEGDPFVGVQSNVYWSATEGDGSVAWLVFLGSGYVYNDYKDSSNYVWPVRGGQ